MPDRIWS